MSSVIWLKRLMPWEKNKWTKWFVTGCLETFIIIASYIYRNTFTPLKLCMASTHQEECFLVALWSFNVHVKIPSLHSFEPHQTAFWHDLSCCNFDIVITIYYDMKGFNVFTLGSTIPFHKLTFRTCSLRNNSLCYKFILLRSNGLLDNLNSIIDKYIV